MSALAVPVAAQPGDQAPPVAPSALTEYRIAVNDVVKITVFEEPSLSGDFVVDSTGVIALRLIGDVKAEGYTIADLTKVIHAKYADGYLLDPKISVEMASFSPFYITGEVNAPGEYAYTNGLTVMNAIIRAKGYTYRANKNRVFIKHIDENAERLLPRESVTTTPVRPGDTIRVAERYF